MSQENQFSISPKPSSENPIPRDEEHDAESNLNNEDGPDDELYEKFVKEIEEIYDLYKTAKEMSEQITAMVELETFSFHSLLERFGFEKVIDEISQLQRQKKTAPNIVDLISQLEPDITKRRQLLEKILQDAKELEDESTDKLKQNPENNELTEQLEFYKEYYDSPGNYVRIVESQIKKLMKTDRHIWGPVYRSLFGRNDNFLEIFTTLVMPESDKAEKFSSELEENEGNLFRLLNAREKKRKEILEAIHREAEQLKQRIEEAFTQVTAKLDQEHEKFINDLTADIDKLPVEFTTEDAGTAVMQLKRLLEETKNKKISEHQQKRNDILEKKKQLLDTISSLNIQG